MSRANFRLAVLSDVHLAPLPPLSIMQLAGKRLTGFLNWHLARKREHDMRVLDAAIAGIKAQTPDHILFCGDAVNLGLPSEFVRARQFLEQLGPPADVTAIPGNHDLYVDASRAPMIDAFRPFMLGDEETAVQFPFVRRRDGVALIGLNSALPTPPFDATGTLGVAQIAATQHLLQSMPDEWSRVVALHHPATVDGTAKGRELTDAAAFSAMFRSVHADLILHGHNHYRSLRWIDGPRGKIPVLGVMSGSGTNHAFGGIPGFMIVDVPRTRAETITVTAHEIQADRSLRTTTII